MITEPIVAFSSARYSVQNVGERSRDGLGWVWQCNVFSHYVLVRLVPIPPTLVWCNAHHYIPHMQYLHAKLVAYPKVPRVLWMSSNEAQAKLADPQDWQLLSTHQSYQASKYQMDLIGTQLDSSSKVSTVRHFVVQPGIAHTNIGKALIGALMEVMKVFMFYLVRNVFLSFFCFFCSPC